MARAKDFEVVGVHLVEPSGDVFEETLGYQWGAGLSGAELEDARARVREHFAGLYLVEVRVDPPSAEIDWGGITQPVPGTPATDWQAPYDEQCVDQNEGRWAFFFHDLQVDEPIDTPVGARSLPRPSPLPSHLAGIRYGAP